MTGSRCSGRGRRDPFADADARIPIASPRRGTRRAVALLQYRPRGERRSSRDDGPCVVGAPAIAGWLSGSTAGGLSGPEASISRRSWGRVASEWPPGSLLATSIVPMAVAVCGIPPRHPCRASGGGVRGSTRPEPEEPSTHAVAEPATRARPRRHLDARPRRP